MAQASHVDGEPGVNTVPTAHSVQSVALHAVHEGLKVETHAVHTTVGTNESSKKKPASQ